MSPLPSISFFGEKSNRRFLPSISRFSHNYQILSLVISLSLSYPYWAITEQLGRKIKGLFRRVHGVFSLTERTFPTKARRCWRRHVVGVCPVQSMPGVCIPSVNSSGGCVLLFSRRKKCRFKPNWPWNRGLIVMPFFSSYESAIRFVNTRWWLMLSDKAKKCKNKIEVEFLWRNKCNQGSNCKSMTPLTHFLRYPLYFSLWMKEDGHIFIGMFGRRIGNADFVEKIVLIVYIEVRLRFIIILKTLMRTNWHQIVVLPRLVSCVMGFTNTIQNQPQEKERQTNRTGAKGSKKY
ncbi:unnamed protein product [Arabidopsis halleri]